ncbi:Dihydroorotate dehydrogenase [Granulibacter bethesdensis]|uniref:Dihydroorotate dehydrogenase (quinone) n=1 Tax=Granulibacter bethesdensis TaxID=364410 RepID=A0AAN0RF26_9PROT|nr:quinone-dependent dihydroorotate dehydrogenase [Granulibacter bethesdensis]AHJ63761.1 Dihydroorotate dehydrogenase [Granulibacter bethesdensis]
MLTNLLRQAGFAALRRMDAEHAHEWGLRALSLGLAGRQSMPDDPRLAVSAFGRRFAHPLGLAAGFDKNARAVLPLLRLGFAWVEAGTVTPRPQSGNPRPRLFRLREDRAVINRMGFNNDGIAVFLNRLKRLKHHPAPIGVNIGINKEGAKPETDYADLVAAVAPYADTITVNISSPNTPGLRDLQGEEKLAAILASITRAVPQRPPLLVKIAPDLSDEGLEGVVRCCIAAGVDGLIISNTTIARPAGLRSPYAEEAGGLSGRPLLAASTRMLGRAALLSEQLAPGRLTLVGCGGVASGADLLTKIEHGATMVQLYSAFALQGPSLLPRILKETQALLEERGYRDIAAARGKALQGMTL